MGTAAASDPSERSPALVCDDGVDNDSDGLTDFPQDPDCSSPTDSSESSGPPGELPWVVVVPALSPGSSAILVGLLSVCAGHSLRRRDRSRR